MPPSETNREGTSSTIYRLRIQRLQWMKSLPWGHQAGLDKGETGRTGLLKEDPDNSPSHKGKGEEGLAPDGEAPAKTTAYTRLGKLVLK